jgi:hypothetical protein
MIQTGSRLLIGAAVLATVGAVVYGVTQHGSLGTTGLIFAAAALAFLAGVNLFFRDSDVSAMDPTGTTQSAAAVPPPTPTLWPLIGAAGAVMVVVGIVSYPVVFIFGIIALIASAAEWMVQAWSERASADGEFNAVVRARISHPLEFPVLALVGAGIIIYSFSRIMLFLSKASGPALFSVLAALILVAGFIIAFRPSVRNGAIATVGVIAALGLIAGGAAAALEGERDLHPHPTTQDLSAVGDCDTSDETEADENASQSLADKASIAGEVILRSDDTLVAKNQSVTGEQDTFVVTRSNPTNIRFVNDSNEDRRLVLDLGTKPALDADGNPIEDTRVPNQICTALVEDGGSQFLTFSIPVASAYADQPYRFVVPGVEGAEVAVVVS